MTQSAIAGHLGFSTSYMNDVLKGKRAVTDAFVRRVLERGAME
jgi:plasmid maintenance system antidote protein VapI